MYFSEGYCQGVPAGAAAAGQGKTGPRAAAGAAPAGSPALDVSRRIGEELPFLRQNVRRWHREKASAEDLVQDTLLQALANAHRWRPGSNLRAWLATIMRNQFLAAAARSKRSAKLLEMIAGTHPACPPDPREPRLLLRDVERALRRLPRIQRMVLFAVVIEDRSYEEVGQMLGISVGAARCHLARGRDRLRAAVRGDAHPLPRTRRRARPIAAALALAAE